MDAVQRLKHEEPKRSSRKRGKQLSASQGQNVQVPEKVHTGERTESSEVVKVVRKRGRPKKFNPQVKKTCIAKCDETDKNKTRINNKQFDESLEKQSNTIISPDTSLDKRSVSNRMDNNSNFPDIPGDDCDETEMKDASAHESENNSIVHEYEGTYMYESDEAKITVRTSEDDDDFDPFDENSLNTSKRRQTFKTVTTETAHLPKYNRKHRKLEAMTCEQCGETMKGYARLILHMNEKHSVPFKVSRITVSIEVCESK